MITRLFGPPRLVVRTSLAMFAVVAIVLTAVLLLIAIQGSGYVRETVTKNLESAQRMLSALEERQSRELLAQVAVVAESPTLKAAIDTYQAEIRRSDANTRSELIRTIDRELEKVASRLKPDVVAVSDPAGNVLAVAGQYWESWPSFVAPPTARKLETVVTLPSGVFRRFSTPLALQDVEIGFLSVATALDKGYATRMSDLSGASTLVASEGRVIATTLPDAAAAALSEQVIQQLPGTSTIRLSGDEYVVRQVVRTGQATVYTLDSIDGAVNLVMSNALEAIVWLGVVVFSLAGLVSLWTARSLARPIDTLSKSLSEMTESRNFETPLLATGSSLEVDALTRSFNSMMATVAAAEAETQSTYVGAIRALALALDARDPYTAGHSERVSAISVTIGRQMALDAEDIDILRLGALLHDIGKIGISDHVLRKPEALTAEEFELIKEHPVLGARMLRSVPFLTQHLPIVELHHERPDGRGYPYGLTADEIPMLARIVHVADAFDAMTSARAYRPALDSGYAIRELWRCAGTQFDAEVVQALVQAVAEPGKLTTEQAAADVAKAATPRKLALVPARS
ncbi:MAG TPA: HD-GYP domain-containing protein [Vicinamibacterales bacterium]|nr:HD-GYP domain-containing protein [Vicinamibacterales bacterium]